jgi:hypothetical protein
MTAQGYGRPGCGRQIGSGGPAGRFPGDRDEVGHPAEQPHDEPRSPSPFVGGAGTQPAFTEFSNVGLTWAYSQRARHCLNCLNYATSSVSRWPATLFTHSNPGLSSSDQGSLGGSQDTLRRRYRARVAAMTLVTRRPLSTKPECRRMSRRGIRLSRRAVPRRDLRAAPRLSRSVVSASVWPGPIATEQLHTIPRRPRRCVSLHVIAHN